MAEGTRFERRSGSRRARMRVSNKKVDRFLALRQQGLPPAVMASCLGMSRETVNELLEIAESGEGGGDHLDAL